MKEAWKMEVETMKEVFSCRRCGFCCQGETTVSLNAEDQRRMLDFLQISRREAMEKYWRDSGGQVQMRVQNGHCIFFDDGCSVHQGRPWRCRQWPLVDAILVDEGTLAAIKDSCPGLDGEASYPQICEEVRRCRRGREIDSSGKCGQENDAS